MIAPDERYTGFGKPDKFSGKETDWSDWKFTFCSWPGMYDSEMDGGRGTGRGRFCGLFELQ